MSLETFESNKTLEEEMPPEVKIPHEHPEAIHELGKNIHNLENSPRYINIEAIKQECVDNPHLLKLLESMREQCFYYTETVCRWHELGFKSGEMTTEEFQEEFQTIDESRHRSHEAMIADMRILAREMNKAGKNGNWVNNLHARHDFGNAALGIAFQEMIAANRGIVKNDN